jgi:hypothetical protein
VGFVAAAAADPVGSYAVLFAAMEHLVSASGIVAIASEIGGAAFASAFVFGSSALD